MPDTALDDLANLTPIPGSALAYFVSGGVDYNGTVNDLFVGRTLSETVAFAIRSSGAAFDVAIASAEAITAKRTLSLVLGNADRTLTVGASASVSGTNTGDQTTVSGNAGTATALQTARAIYGNNFDGTAALTQIIASTFGGTGNGFTKFSGPTTSEKTFTLPDATCSILTTNSAVSIAQGGTGQTTASAAFNALAPSKTGNALKVLRVNAGETDYELATLAGGGDALTTDPLSQFAATTSLQLKGVISDETGSGALVFADTPTLIAPLLGTPTSGTLTNCTGLPPATGIVGWPADSSGVLTNDGAGVLSWAAAGGSQTPWTANVDADGFSLLVDDGTGIFSSEAGNPELLKFTSAASAVNELTVTNAATGNSPIISATGSDANVGINAVLKGSSSFVITPAASIQSTLMVRHSDGTARVQMGVFAGLTTYAGIWFGNVTPTDNNYGFIGDGSSEVILNAPATNKQVVLKAGQTVRIAEFENAGLRVNSGLIIGWSSSTSATQPFVATDTGLARNAAGIAEVNNGTAGQWGALKSGVRDAGTTTVTNGLTVGHQSTGTPAAGFGAAALLNLNSSSTADQAAAQFKAAWNVATHASRTAYAGITTNAVGSTSLVDRFITGGHTAVATDNTALSLFEVALATLQGAAGRIVYEVFCTDGTDVQSRRGTVMYSAVNKAGTYTTEVVIIAEAASASTGTLTATWGVANGTNKVTLQITPDTSLASPTSYYVKWSLENLSESVITVL